MSIPIYIDLSAPQLVERPGDRPLATRSSIEVAHPHQQLTQTGPAELGDRLVARAAALPGVVIADSCVSVPGARAFRLDESVPRGPDSAFQCGTEFAHVHPPADGSLHVALPIAVREEVFRQGWGEPHPISGTALVYSPRDSRELEIVWQLVIASYRHAVGGAGEEQEP